MTSAGCGLNGPGMLLADVTDLLSAIVEALDIPLPSIEDGNERKHYRLLERRASDVRVALAAMLAHPHHTDLCVDAEYIRNWIAQYPVTYTPFDSGRTEGEGR